MHERNYGTALVHCAAQSITLHVVLKPFSNYSVATPHIEMQYRCTISYLSLICMKA